MLHQIQASEDEYDLPSFAWHRGSNHPFAFAVGGEDGRVRVWRSTTGKEPPTPTNLPPIPEDPLDRSTPTRIFSTEHVHDEPHPIDAAEMESLRDRHQQKNDPTSSGSNSTGRSGRNREHIPIGQLTDETLEYIDPDPASTFTSEVRNPDESKQNAASETVQSTTVQGAETTSEEQHRHGGDTEQFVKPSSLDTSTEANHTQTSHPSVELQAVAHIGDQLGQEALEDIIIATPPATQNGQDHDIVGPQDASTTSVEAIGTFGMGNISAISRRELARNINPSGSMSSAPPERAGSSDL